MSDRSSPSSDGLLHALRRMAEQDIEGEYSISRIKPEQLLALVFCVEALQSIVLDMESGWIANHSRSAEKNYELLLSTALEALGKLK